jgi:hypothetical protein
VKTAGLSCSTGSESELPTGSRNAAGSEPKRLKELERNARLKKLLADAMLDL